MDAEIKRKWVEALRSGKYAQTKSHLRDREGYCCLGVLCDILRPEWSGHNGETHYRHLGANSFPDPTIINQAGVEGDTDSTEREHPLWTAAHMNDNGKSFAEIADYIEEHL